MRRSPGGLAVSIFAAMLWPAASLALDPPGIPPESLRARQFHRPELSVPTAYVPAESLGAELAKRPGWMRLLAEAGPRARVFIDTRTGTPASLWAATPMIPGRGIGNAVTVKTISASLGRPVTAVDAGTVADLVARFVLRHAAAMSLDPAQLGPARAAQVSAELWHVRIAQVVDGIPVRGGQIVAALSHGNLVLLGTELWGTARIGTTPLVDAAKALELGFAYAGGRTAGDALWKDPTLEIVPIAPTGGGIGHALVWTFGFRRGEGNERWDVLVDAHDGTVLSFEDTNLYEAQTIQGGAYPLTNTGICPANTTCGVMQPGTPMPYANTGLPAPNDFADAAGVFDYSGGTVTTTLNGRFVRMLDTCGPIGESSSIGALDLGGVNGQHDCTSAGASPGDTAASRSGYYELNKLIEMAKGWLPSNPWLAQKITSNMNIVDTCNAFYSPADGTINFFRSGGGCRNTGEIAAVFDHEWGHALDDNDSVGALSVSSEAYADIASIYRLRASCVGYGFFATLDKGCGMTADGTGFNVNESLTASHCALNCSGVRDTDWEQHANASPATPLGFVCTQCTGGSGPCGAQTHCSAAPSRQAAWDLVARDLQAPPLNLTREDAFDVGAKIFYQGSGAIGAWHACTCGGSANGCGATNAYPQWLAADDDDGDVTNGTPHMTAIFAAFDRHGIACPDPAPVNSGCAGGPTAAPALGVTSGDRQASLSWTAVPGAARYRVLRTEGYAGCDFGKAMIQETVGTSFTDVALANERDYHYVVQPVGASGACMGPVSACAAATPLACAGALSMDRATYGCSDTIVLRLADHDLRGAGTQTVAIRSTVETTAEIVTLVESPAGSGKFQGTIATSSDSPAADGILEVAHGSTVTAEYVDASSCGASGVLIQRGAAIDCTGEACFGTLALDRTTYSCSSGIQITVADSDLAGQGVATVGVRSTVEASPEIVALTESPAGSGTFVGSILATSAAPAADGKISATNGSTLTVEYLDASACGIPSVTVPRTAIFDCAPPLITNVRVEGITGSTAVVRWDTNEPSTSFVTYGGARPPGTTTPTLPALVTSHAVSLTGLPECATQYYSVGSADVFAQQSVANNAGAFFQFAVGADVPVSVTSTDPPVPLPPGPPFTAMATIPLADTRTIVDVNVRFSMSHTFVGVTNVFLRHPDGTVVTLSNHRGGTGDNFIDTVFDDEAAVPIGSGAAPFTGSFRPDGSLASLDGKSVQGTWQLQVFDDVSGAGGTIQDFDLLFTLAQPCAPHAIEETSTRASDACAAGGAGNGDGFWDPGESAAIRVTLRNDGQEDLTGVFATVTPATAGVAMIDDFASFPDLPRGATAESLSPHFTAFLPTGFACGAPIAFNVSIRTAQGTFGDAFGLGTSGRIIPAGSATTMLETFASGIPATWTIEDRGNGGGAASTWTTSNPGNRTATPPISSPFAIVDSAAAGAAATQDERLYTPLLNLSAAVTVTLEFDSWFSFKAGGGDEQGEVDVGSSLTGGDLVNVFRYQNGSSANPDHRTLNITSQAAGAPDVQIRFRYDNGAFDNWWMLDNVKVSHTFAASCTVVPCAQVTAPGEVLHINFDSKTAVSWSLAAAASTYTLYRGAGSALPALLTSAIDSCARATTTSTSATGLVEVPAPGTFFWWIVRASNANGAGTAGDATAGPRIQNSSGNCP